MTLDDPFDLETFRSWAAHEAAHAVVTAALGIPVVRVLVVQLSSELKLGFSGYKPKEDCSHSQPDAEAYRAAPPVHRCMIARAGEVGQRLQMRAPAILPRENWVNDADEIARESGLSGAGLEDFLSTLGDAVRAWLQEPGPRLAWQTLLEALEAGRVPHPAHKQSSFRSVLEGEPLQKLLAATPPFPGERLPAMAPAGEFNPIRRLSS